METMVINGKEFVEKDSITNNTSCYTDKDSLHSFSIGKKVICRGYISGINVGIVKAADKNGVILENARRLWYHEPSDSNLSWYEGVSISGLSDSSKISPTVPIKIIIEKYELTFCNDEAFESIMKKETNKLT